MEQRLCILQEIEYSPTYLYERIVFRSLVMRFEWISHKRTWLSVLETTDKKDQWRQTMD